jgi:hypothetical protein
MAKNKEEEGGGGGGGGGEIFTAKMVAPRVSA